MTPYGWRISSVQVCGWSWKDPPVQTRRVLLHNPRRRPLGRAPICRRDPQACRVRTPSNIFECSDIVQNRQTFARSATFSKRYYLPHSFEKKSPRIWEYRQPIASLAIGGSVAALKSTKSVGAVWPAEPPKRPSLPAPGWDAFIWLPDATVRIFRDSSPSWGVIDDIQQQERLI
jgi:hypothetical protein